MQDRKLATGDQLIEESYPPVFEDEQIDSQEDLEDLTLALKESLINNLRLAGY